MREEIVLELLSITQSSTIIELIEALRDIKLYNCESCYVPVLKSSLLLPVLNKFLVVMTGFASYRVVQKDHIHQTTELINPDIIFKRNTPTKHLINV